MKQVFKFYFISPQTEQSIFPKWRNGRQFHLHQKQNRQNEHKKALDDFNIINIMHIYFVY